MNKACEICGGSCCKGLRINIGREPQDTQRWLTYHGTLEGDFLVLPTPCSQLVDGKCDIHDQRPDVCRNFQVGGRSCREAIDHYAKDRKHAIIGAMAQDAQELH